MEKSVVEKMVIDKLPDAVVKIEGDGCNFSISVTSKKFEGVSAIDRHRQINSIFKDKIQTGELHALSIKTYTI